MRRLALGLICALAFLAGTSTALAPPAPVFNDFTTGAEGFSTYNGTQAINQNHVLISTHTSGGYMTVSNAGSVNRTTYTEADRGNPFFVTGLFGGGDAGGSMTWKLRVFNSFGVQVLDTSGTAVPRTVATEVAAVSQTFNPSLTGGLWPAGGSFEVRLSYGGIESGDVLETDHIDQHFNPVNPPPPPECSDGQNNDPAEDLFVDFPQDPGCTSATDNTELGNPPPAVEPPAPGNFRLSNLDGRCLIEWDAVPGAESYEVYIDGAWPGPFTTGTSYERVQANGTTSQLRVSAYDAQADAFDDDRLTTNGAPAEDGHGPWTVALTCQPQGEPPPEPACSDQLDNDADGLIDFPADPGCSSATDNDESNAPPPPPFGDIYDEPFPNSPMRRPANGVAFDANSATLVNTFLTNAMNVNSGRGPGVFTDAKRWRGRASDPDWTIRGNSVGGSTVIDAPFVPGGPNPCTSGPDPTMVIHGVDTGKTVRLYGGDSGSCSINYTTRTITGQNLGVDTNGDGAPEQGIGTAAGRLNPEGAMIESDRVVLDHRVGFSHGNNDNARSFRAPALSFEQKSFGPAYPVGVPHGTTFCHLWTQAEIDGFQNANGMSGLTRQVSDAFTEGLSCTRGYGAMLRDGTGDNGVLMYFNAAELGLSDEQGRQAVRMGAGGGGSTSIPFWENQSKWRALVAG